MALMMLKAAAAGQFIFRTPAATPPSVKLDCDQVGIGVLLTKPAGGSVRVLDVSEVQIRPDTFQDWLDEHTDSITGTRCDNEPGIVFAWTEHGKLAHATVSIGDGWMFGKDSQAWSSPRMVSPVRKVVNSWVYPTARLARYRIAR